MYFKNMYYVILSKFPNVNSATSGEGDGSGIVLKWFTDGFKKQIVDLFMWMLTGLFEILTPFVTWGCKILIVWCIISFYCTKDNKNLSLGMKSFLVYLIFVMIKGVIT